jgi:hypothetical protein
MGIIWLTRKLALGATVTFQNGQIDVTTANNTATTGTVSNTTSTGETQSATTTGDSQLPASIQNIEAQFAGINTGADPSNSYMAMNVDGQWYIALSAFGHYAAWNGQQATVSYLGTILLPYQRIRLIRPELMAFRA